MQVGLIARSRAMVVLPTPGGPQKISDPQAARRQHRAQGAIGAQHLVLADHLGQARGRSRSASGRALRLRPSARGRPPRRDRPCVRAGTAGSRAAGPPARSSTKAICPGGLASRPLGEAPVSMAGPVDRPQDHRRRRSRRAAPISRDPSPPRPQEGSGRPSSSDHHAGLMLRQRQARQRPRGGRSRRAGGVCRARDQRHGGLRPACRPIQRSDLGASARCPARSCGTSSRRAWSRAARRRSGSRRPAQARRRQRGFRVQVAR
jgi:hypothetical protein